MELLARVIIHKYVRSVEVSKSRRATYYMQGEKIPLKYSDKIGLDYQWIQFTDGIYLCDAQKKPIIKNIKSAGTAKVKVIAGNDLHALRMKDYDRAKIVKAIKEQFKLELTNIKPIIIFPIKVRFDFYNNELENYDLDNHSLFYTKCFFDSLTDMKIIPDDSVKYITSFACNYKKTDERRLIVSIFGI